jgi:hypothetical protein
MDQATNQMIKPGTHHREQLKAQAVGTTKWNYVQSLSSNPRGTASNEAREKGKQMNGKQINLS